MVVLALSLVYCGGSKQDEPLRKNIDLASCFKTFLTVQDLENFGFEHLAFPHMGIPFFVGDSYFLGNSGDKRMVKIKGNKVVKSYQAYGQAGGEFMAMGPFFLQDPNTISIHDTVKGSILLFDLDLNYLSEKRMSTSFINQITKITEDRYIASVHNRDFIFYFLDKDFNVLERFLKADRKTPFKKMFSFMMGTGMILDEKTAAYTILWQTNRDAFVDIYDIHTRKKTLTLKWKSPYPLPTQKDIDQRRNIYFAGGTVKCSEFYFIFNTFAKNISINPNEVVSEIELVIFNDKGQLLFQKTKFPFPFVSSNDKKHVFAVDEDCNILVADISDIRKKLN